ILAGFASGSTSILWIFAIQSHVPWIADLVILVIGANLVLPAPHSLSAQFHQLHGRVVPLVAQVLHLHPQELDVPLQVADIGQLRRSSIVGWADEDNPA